MKPSSAPPAPKHRGIPLFAVLLLGAVILLLLAIFQSFQTSPTSAENSTRHSVPTVTPTRSQDDFGIARAANLEPSAEEIVAEKLGRFIQGHEAIVAVLAKQYNVTAPEEVGRFFAALHAGNWPEATNLFASLKNLMQSKDRPPGLEKIWPAIMETHGVAEQTQAWPAQQLLDYGNAILDSLRPGMIYTGGTDAGRFIPTLLADTSMGEPPVVLTQNALADGSYLDYVRFRYGDRLNTLSDEDSQKGFTDYLADAQKRLQHDQQFPDEPKQVRPGEDIQIKAGSVHVSGQVAVMSINERLLQTLLQKNPTLSFALEESFPLKSFYNAATPLGPITELRADPTANPLTAERAAQSLDYWRSLTQPLLTTPAATSAPNEAYAKMILSQANLYENRNLTDAAEQAFQLAHQLNPGNSVVIFSYVQLLTRQNRYDEARQLAQAAVNAAPQNEQFRGLLTSLNRGK